MPEACYWGRIIFPRLDVRTLQMKEHDFHLICDILLNVLWEILLISTKTVGLFGIAQDAFCLFVCLFVCFKYLERDRESWGGAEREREGENPQAGSSLWTRYGARTHKT